MNNIEIKNVGCFFSIIVLTICKWLVYLGFLAFLFIYTHCVITYVGTKGEIFVLSIYTINYLSMFSYM